MKENYKIKAVKEVLEIAKNEGLETWFYCDECEEFYWGYILTKNNNILYVEWSVNQLQVTLSLAYVPSTTNGSSCGLGRDSVIIKNYDDILVNEIRLLGFARELKADLYKNPVKQMQQKLEKCQKLS